MNIDEITESIDNLSIYESFIVANKKINNSVYKNIMCSISGGSDSDILIDIFSKLDPYKKIIYVFFDTGLEYEATKKHLDYLQQKYGIEFVIQKAKKPIPTCCRKYGQPFLSKQVSEWVQRLQRHNFKWEDKPFEELYAEYPKCKAALKWWCNKYEKKKDGTESKFNIAYNKYLKEFMVDNPPDFNISNKCCYYAKKKVAAELKECLNIDLSVTGIRKAEGGARASAYKNCFSNNSEKGTADEYRPLFWYTESDKNAYEQQFDILHSECYSVYGLKRTGCAGCPFGNDFEVELQSIAQYEPKLYKAVNNIFGKSYEYTRKYKDYVAMMKGRENHD